MKRIRLTSVVINNIAFQNVPKWRNSLRFDYKTEKKMISRLKRTGPISIKQYEKLFWEKIVYSRKISYFRIQELLNSVRVRFNNVDDFCSELLVSHHENFKSVKLYHNYTHIDNIIRIKDKYKIPLKGVFFDDELFLDLLSQWNTALKPDGCLTLKNELFFIETDMGTEKWELIFEKLEKYEKISKEILHKSNYEGINIIFFSSPSRIIKLRESEAVTRLEKLCNIEYYSN